MLIIWIFQAQSVLKLFKFYVKLILNQTVCLEVKTEKDYEEFLELLNIQDKADLELLLSDKWQRLIAPTTFYLPDNDLQLHEFRSFPAWHC